MRIICDKNNLVIFTGECCEFGTWEDEEKWKIDEHLYAIDYGYSAFDVEWLPKDFEEGKYLFINGAFVVNPDYVEPPKSDAERLAEIEFALQTADETAIELFEMTMLQEEINNAQDDAIIEIYEMLS